MKKKLFTLILAVCFVLPCALMLSACAGHTHSYTIKHSDIEHWYECSECGDVKDGVRTSHTWESECDELCDDCGYKRQVKHSYSATMSHDTTHHWYQCIGCEDRDGYAEHDFGSTCGTECLDCGYTRTVEHNYQKVLSHNETHHWYACEDCAAKKNETEHVFDDACDTTCDDCGYTRTVTHDYSETLSKDATHHWYECSICGDKKDYAEHDFGSTCGTECLDCGYTRTVEHNYQKVLSHNETHHWYACEDCAAKKNETEHVFDDACDTTCDDCGYTRTVTHDYSETLSKDATHHWYECSICGDKKDYAEHDFGSTCGTECLDCGYTRTVEHNYQKVLSHNETHHWYACEDCTAKKDETEHVFDDACDTTCDDCGYTRVVSHSYDNDCDTTCNLCSHTRTVTHDYSETLSKSSTHHWYECGICGDKKDYAEHTLQSGECTVCGYVDLLDIIYIPEAESYSINALKDSSATSVTIPTTFNDGVNGPRAVTSIAQGAFSGKTNLTSVTIPAGITSIGTRAFAGCPDLTISVASDNTAYSMAGNCLIENETKILLAGFADSIIPTDGSVTSIAEYAFYGVSGFATMAIPTTILSIGEKAFYGCTGLTSMVVPNSITQIGASTFGGCTELTSITLPFVGSDRDGTSSTLFGYIFGATEETENATSLPTKLATVAITDTTIVGRNAFYGCKSITTITLPANLETIGEYAFAYFAADVTIPSSVTTIVKCAFLQNTGTISDLPAGLTSLGAWAFYKCNTITSVTIPAGVSVLSSGAFQECENLASVTLFEGLTKINDSVFLKTAITEITIPASVTTIAQSAFQKCHQLVSINVASGNSKYHSSGNCLIETATKTLLLGCKNAVIPTDNSVTSVVAFSFSGGVTDLVIPANITSIAQGALRYCFDIVNLTLPYLGGSVDDTENATLAYIFGGTKYYSSAVPDTLKTVVVTGGTSLARGAFYERTSITSIVLAEGITNMTIQAFEGCTALTKVVLPSTLESLGLNAFQGCDSVDVYYNGTADDWGEVGKETSDGSLNGGTNIVIYYYSATRPTDSGNYWHYVANEPTPWT